MLAVRFPEVRWTDGPKRGPAANRNHGASLATGDFIIFLDDDVEPQEGLIASYQAAIVDDVNVYEGRTTCRAGIHSPLEHSPVNETGGWLWSCNMMVRASFWRSLGGFDEEFPYPAMEDVALRERLRQSNERFVFVPGAVVDHPPRRLPPGRVLARFHESYVTYHYKYLGSKPSLVGFSGFLVRHRLRIVFQFPMGPDSLRAVASLGSELLHTSMAWRSWDHKWRDQQGNVRQEAALRTSRVRDKVPR
jgi:GT2 family glycosyltransferase